MMCLKKRSYYGSRSLEQRLYVTGVAIPDFSTSLRLFAGDRIEALQNSAGEWITDYQEVKKLVFDYWLTLFQEEANYSSTTRLLWDYVPEISKLDKLSRPLGTCEVLNAIKSMKAFQAPGPDGFQPLFFQRYWELVSENVIRLVGDVLAGRDFPEGLNNLVLIPKVDVPQKANQFRPSVTLFIRSLPTLTGLSLFCRR